MGTVVNFLKVILSYCEMWFYGLFIYQLRKVIPKNSSFDFESNYKSSSSRVETFSKGEMNISVNL